MKLPVFSEDSSDMFDWYDTSQGFYILRKAIIYTYHKCCQYEGCVTDKEISDFADALQGLSALVNCIEMFKPTWRDSFDPVLVDDLYDFLGLLDSKGGLSDVYKC